MRATPEDLEDLNREIGHRSLWPNTSNPGWAVAFLRICKALEPNLVFSKDEERLDWLKGVGAIEFHLPKIETGGYQKDFPIKAEVYQCLFEIADRCWRGSAATIRELPFIKNLDLRRVAERDLASLSNVQKAAETKSALILGGSVIEAILWDVIEDLKTKDPTGIEAKATSAKNNLVGPNPRSWKYFDPTDDSRWTLEQMVGVCGPNGLGVLSERTVRMAHTIRDYRNLVHPRKELQDQNENGQIRLHDAVGAEALMEGVIDQVSRWRAANP